MYNFTLILKTCQISCVFHTIGSSDGWKKGKKHARKRQPPLCSILSKETKKPLGKKALAFYLPASHYLLIKSCLSFRMKPYLFSLFIQQGTGNA